MKKAILILLFSLTLFASNDSCKLDVYFGNGVWNSSKQAEASMLMLKQSMQINNRTRFSVANDGVTYDFKYLHNKTYGQIDDLIETYWQLYDSGQISQGYFTFMTRELNAVDGLISTYTQRIQNIIDSYNLDIDTMINNYRKSSFNLNYNVLLVAHSQGNLFGNRLYNLLTDKEKKKFKMVSVATPANNVAEDYNLDAPYTTIKLDYAMVGIKNSFPGNADGFGHTFVESYLMSGTLATRNKIMSDINSAITSIDSNSCIKYKYLKWFGHVCASRDDVELKVDIYGAEIVNANGWVKLRYITTDKSERAFESGECSIEYNSKNMHSSAIMYTRRANIHDDKDGCFTYNIDGTSAGHTIDFIANKIYNEHTSCTKYKMNDEVTKMLKELE